MSSKSLWLMVNARIAQNMKDHKMMARNVPLILVYPQKRLLKMELVKVVQHILNLQMLIEIVNQTNVVTEKSYWKMEHVRCVAISNIKTLMMLKIVS